MAETEITNITQEYINEYCSNTEVIRFMRSKFKRISRIGAVNLIKALLHREPNIKVDILVTKKKAKTIFLRYNAKFFNKSGLLSKESIISLERELNGFLLEIGKDIIQYDEEKHIDFKVKTIEGIDCYVIDKMTMYEKVRKLICDEGGDINFTYNFNNSDMNNKCPENKDTLQRCQIQILSKPIKFDYPIEYKYSCPRCENKTIKKANETVSTGNRILCQGIYTYINGEGEAKSKVCNMNLIPDGEISNTKDCYYYDIGYENEDGDKHSAGCISFCRLEPGFYDTVLFRIKNPKKTELYQIIDTKTLMNNKFEIPIIDKKENYLFTLQKAFDKFIKKQTKMNVYGLLPIKIALIIQTLNTLLKNKLIMNIQVVGDASTGKSTVLKYYGFLLNNHLNLTTNGLSTSIPALRGTKVMVNLMGKESKIITTGYLGTYYSIHIDEAGENKELVQNLKTFLMEDNYSYDKAGATGIFHKRTTHINISENLDYNHLGQYCGAIRKAYKELDIKIGEDDKQTWDEKWDLHLPIVKYENPYLHKVIKEKRMEFKNKQLFWIDGYDYPLHERFPFYFYLVNEKKDEKLNEIIKGNVVRNTISENLELIRCLKSKNIINFFKSLINYRESKHDKEAFSKVDEILNNYGLHTDARMKIFYYTLIMLSRIINQRLTIEEMDYDLLKWFLENTNCKLDVVDTNIYKIEGPPNLEYNKEIERKIEESSKVDDSFGMPDDEFK